jgi:uncharacterized protein
MVFAVKLVLGLILLYAALLAGGALLQRKLMYHPDPRRVPPAAAGLKGVKEVALATPDGESLVMWYSEARPGRRTILYFHGNGAGLDARSERFQIMTGEGYGAAMLAYRGYAGSSGSPSEAANVADAKLAYDWLAAKGVGPDDIVLFGESLGSGVAVQVAAARPVAGIVLDSPYTSIADVAVLHYPFPGVHTIIRDRYDTMAIIGRVQAPLLIFHGEADPVVPFALGKRLYEAANEPKRLAAFPGEGHLVPFTRGSWSAVRDFLEQLAPARR